MDVIELGEVETMSRGGRRRLGRRWRIALCAVAVIVVAAPWVDSRWLAHEHETISEATVAANAISDEGESQLQSLLGSIGDRVDSPAIPEAERQAARAPLLSMLDLTAARMAALPTNPPLNTRWHADLATAWTEYRQTADRRLARLVLVRSHLADPTFYNGDASDGGQRG